MVEFYYNCSIDESSTHSPFEVMYGYQPSASADQFVPLNVDAADAIDRLTLIVDIRDGVNRLL